MAAVLFHEPVFATIVESGDKLYFYEVGTTTDLTVYLDAALSTEAPQPVDADSFGRFPPIYLDTTANPPKVVLDDFEDVQKWTTDVYPLEDTASLAQDVAQLQIDVEAAEGVGLANQSDIVQLQTVVADHETRITALEGDDGGIPAIETFVGNFATSGAQTGSITIPVNDTSAIVCNWGNITASGNGSATDNLETPFTEAYQGYCSYGQTIGGGDTACAVTALTTTQITVYNSTDSSKRVNWWAVGKISL